MSRQEVFDAINEEREFQIKKWGQHKNRVENPDTDPNWKLAVLVEEVGEVGKANIESFGLKKELIQVAAVATAWLESL